MSSVLREMRHTRRVRRLGELEWFEVAYRVYLAALVGGGIVLWLSGQVTDEPATAEEIANVTTHGPAVLGAFVAISIALGLRSGSDGGPIALEGADVRHLLLAPIARRSVLIQPVVQRLRTMAFGGALVGALAGELAARRLPGSGPAWAAAAALAGAATGLLFVAVAVLTHVLHVPRWAATTFAALVLGMQAGAIAGWWPGPGDGIGSLALWGMRQEPIDLISLAVVVALAAAAVALAGRLRLEPLVRRADLVSQLRFAVTMQDLRTVVLLRRELRGERPRSRPWRLTAPLGRGRHGSVVWQRGWRGLSRYPLARLARMAMLSVAAAVAAVAALRDTTPALVVMAMALYLLGLDALEPLSQEVDHPDQADGVPHERGWLLVRHIAAPALGLVPFALLGAAVVAVAEPAAWAGALALAIPITWLGAGGAAVSVLRDAPDPLAPPVASSAAVPPEFAGFTSTFRLVWPIAISALATVPVLAMRELPTTGTAARSVAGLAVVLIALVWWVRRRDEWRTKLRDFMDAGRRAT